MENKQYEEAEEIGAENSSETNCAEDTKDILATLFKKNNLSYTNKNYSIDWLVDRLGSGKFSMPEYQRKYVWNENQVIALVASILKKLPIPKLYGYYTEEEGGDQTTLVIDGQQRLTSLFMYYWGIFPKKKNKRIAYGKKLQEIAKLCKKYYEDGDQNSKKKLEKTYKLDVDYKFIYTVNEIPEKQIEINLSYRDKDSELSNQEKFRFMDRELEFLIVEGNDYSDAVELFRLYNGGGTPLESQEIRNGIYQNVFLYKKINEYSDSIILKDETETAKSKFEKSNWDKFCGTTESKKEIQRLFQFLSYYFVFNFSKKGDDKNYKKIDSPILNLLKLNYNSHEISSIEKIRELETYKTYENIYRKKGSINTMINNYSDYIAKNGKDTQFMQEEYESIVNFFDCNFEKPGKQDKFNINNLIMIFLILKENYKLKESSNLIIPKEAIYYEAHGIGLSTEGFFKRIFEINKILKQRGVI
ncbi:MAG: DUF262 domain-containing protein [Cetobacterium sp.]